MLHPEMFPISAAVFQQLLLLLQKRQAGLGASENPELQRGAGEFPAVTTKPTIIRMLVCHRGVSLFGCELCFLPPCESRIIYFGSLRVSFPLSLLKGSPPFPPSPPSCLPPSPSQHISVGRENEIPCLRTMASARVTRTASVLLTRMAHAALTNNCSNALLLVGRVEGRALKLCEGRDSSVTSVPSAYPQFVSCLGWRRSLLSPWKCPLHVSRHWK